MTRSPSIPSPPNLPSAISSLIVSIMGCGDGDWFVAIGIDIVPSFQPSVPPPITAGGPSQSSWVLAARLQANGGDPSVLPRTVPLPFIDDPDLRSLINSFRPDDRIAESIAAYNRKHSHNIQGEKIGARFS